MSPSSTFPRITEALAASLLAVAFVLAQTLIGGMRLLFSLPAFALVAVAAFLTLPSLRRFKPEPDRLCLWSSAAFFGYILARAWLSPVAYLARPDTYAVLGGLLVYLLASCIFTTARTRLFLLAFLMAFALVHTLIGAIQFRDGNEYMPISWLQRAAYGRRASGFYICPNHLAGLLEVLGIFAISIVCWSRWPVWGKLLTAYAAGICYVGVVLTGSRGALLSTATSIGAVFVLSLIVTRRAGAAWFWKFAGAGLVVLVAAGLAFGFVLKRSEFLAGRAQSTFELQNMRVELWKAAIQQWKLNPVWGTGSGTYLYYGREFRTERVQVDPVRVHNDYLDLLAEYGIAGAIGVAIFLVAHLRRGFRTFARMGPKRAAVAPRLLSNALALNIGALGSIAAYLVHSVFDFNLHIPANILVLAFVFAIIANPGLEREGERSAPSHFGIWLRAAMCALALLVLVQAVRLLPGEYFAERARSAVRDYRPLQASHYALLGLEREQKNPNLHYYLGRGRTFQGDLTRNPQARQSFYLAALEALQQARAVAPRDETFALETAFVFDRLGRYAEAEWMFAEAMALDPKSRLIRVYYEEHLDQWRNSGRKPPV